MTVFDTLSADEAAGAELAMRELVTVPWAQQLLRAIADNGGIALANKSYLLELRFAHALHHAGILPSYEIPGEGGSKLDFGFQSRGRQFRLELMRLDETSAAVGATNEAIRPDGTRWFSRVMRSDADDPRQSEEGENLKAVERICQKRERGGKPNKFPLPGDAINVLLVDCRTLHLGHPDADDYREIAFGGLAVPVHRRHLWGGRAIMGVFSPGNPLRGAAEARERVHLVGFVNERRFRANDIAKAIWFAANPHLLADDVAAKALLSAWPLELGL